MQEEASLGWCNVMTYSCCNVLMKYLNSYNNFAIHVLSVIFFLFKAPVVEEFRNCDDTLLPVGGAVKPHLEYGSLRNALI